MKKISIFVMAVLAFCITACSSDSEETQVPALQSNELITQGEKFASIHNDCLASIYSSLISSKTRSSSFSPVTSQEVVDAANKYIARHMSKTRANTNEAYVKEESYKTTIEDIRNQMSSCELMYVNKILSDDKNGDAVLESISKDNNLTEIQKKAVICFATTYKASSEYWQQNIDKWEKNLKNVPSTRAVRFHWKEVALADAYWGYTGMLSSGLNIWVGGGAAALGSAFACLK